MGAIKEMSRIGIGGTADVHLLTDPEEQVVTVASPGTDSDDGYETAQTNDSGDLLIDHETLEFVDLDWLPCYRVVVDGDRIRVSAFS
jgi:hypothetical protein